MRDFNTVCSDLVKHLRLTGQTTDGRILWYEGTIPLLFELIGFLTVKPSRRRKTNADRIRAMSDEEIEAWYWWMHKEMMRYTDSHVFLHDWLRQEVSDG